MLPNQLKWYAGAAWMLLWFATTLNAQVTFDLTSVIRPGDPAPVPRELAQASSPSLNDSGQVAFNGDEGVFLNTDGNSAVVAGFGDPVPGGGTFVRSYSRPTLNGRGEIAFLCTTSPNRRAVFFHSRTGISRIAAEGDPAPGGGTFAYPFSTPALNDAGEVAFRSLIEPEFYSGVFLFSQGSLRRLVREGDPAPGGGIFTFWFIDPSINISGQVVFSADVSGGRPGIFLVSGVAITRIVGAGDPAPGGGTFGSFSGTPVINDVGQVAFVARVSAPGHSGIFLYSQGQFAQLVGEGDPAPGGGTFVNLNFPAINASGDVAFGTGLSTGGSGVFLYSEGSVSSIVRPGDASPEGDTFTGGGSPSLNAAGEVAFVGLRIGQLGGVYLFSGGTRTRIAGRGDPVDRDPQFFSAFSRTINGNGSVAVPGSTFPGGNGLFDEALNAILHAGDPSPGGGVFGAVSGASMNDSGEIAFRAGGLYMATGGTFSRIVGSGDPAPGGGSFESLSDVFSINNLGQVMFRARITAPPRNGLFLASGGQITTLVREGDPAPGGGTFTSVRQASFNDQGRVAFVGRVSAPSRSGIYLWSEGRISSLVRAGAPAPGGGTFEFFSDFGYFDSRWLNAVGQVAFTATVSTGRDGIFLYTSGTIAPIARQGDPAPGGGVFSILAFATLNAPGQVAFFGGTSLTRAGDYGVFVHSGGALSKIAVPGDPAPGGGTFTFADDPVLNDRGQVLFAGDVSTGGYGVFLATPR